MWARMAMKDIHKKRNRNETDDIFTFAISPLVWLLLFFFQNEETHKTTNFHYTTTESNMITAPLSLVPMISDPLGRVVDTFLKFLSTLKKKKRKKIIYVAIF